VSVQGDNEASKCIPVEVSREIVEYRYALYITIQHILMVEL
jgi:hypothetical protein